MEKLKKVNGVLSFSSLRPLALSCGIDEVGVAQAAPVTEGQTEYLEWLAKGYHGEMDYLARNLDLRFAPQQLVLGAKSIISCLLSYHQKGEGVWSQPPRVSRYAVLRDYHLILKERLYQLLGLLKEEIGAEVEGRAFVDSAPFLDRYWAQQSGLGWIGRQGLLVSPRLGTFTFIGSLLVNIEIEPTPAVEIKNRCGTCQRCVEACPTGALLGDGKMDARRCISYLTIEKKSELTPEETASLHGWAYGCDLCQEVCPWNVRAPETRLQSEVLVDRPLLKAFAAGERSLPKESPMRRARKERLRQLLLLSK